MNNFYKYIFFITVLFNCHNAYSQNNTFSNSFRYPIVFVSRNHLNGGNIFFPSAGLLPGNGPYSRFKITGGKLLIRNENGNVTILIDSTKDFNGIKIVDIQQPCVNWDGERILFTGVESRDSSWRIYEIKKDGTGFRKITHSDRIINLSQFGNAAYRFIKYDDIDPVYLPDGKIIFSSTRYPTLSQFGSYPTTNLFICDSTGQNIFRITSERNGGEKPTIDPVTGKIVYSRWWLNIDMPSNRTATGYTRIDSLAISNDIANLWQTAIINPDGDAIKLFAGDPRERTTLMSYRPRINQGGNLLSIYNPNISFSFTGSSTGIRFYTRGLSTYNFIFGVDTNTRLYISNPPSQYTYTPPYATDAVSLPDGRIMLSAANTVETQDYGLYVCNANGGGLNPVFDLPGTLELNAELLIPKSKPPMVSYLTTYDTNRVPPTTNPSTFYQGGLFRFDCMNIYTNAPVDDVINDAPPITKNAMIRFFLNFQRQDENGLDNPILFREVTVNYDGKITQGDIPANVSMFEQVTDSNRHILVNSKHNIAHVTGFNFDIDGSGTKCVGCHAGHSTLPVPINNSEAQFTNLSTSASVTESSFKSISKSISYNGKNVVDRRARTTDLTTDWIAKSNINEFVELSWQLPIDVRQIKLYNIFPNPSDGTNIQVNDCELSLFRDSVLVLLIPSTGTLTIDGKAMPVSPVQTINKLKVVVKSFTGTIQNQNVAGLAEVEVNARINNYLSTNIHNKNTIAGKYSLEQNYPNPFNPSTLIKFSLPSAQYVSLKVYDITGRLVTILVEGIVEAGQNSISYIPSSLSSGIYLYTIATPHFQETKKMLYIK